MLRRLTNAMRGTMSSTVVSSPAAEKLVSKTLAPSRAQRCTAPLGEHEGGRDVPRHACDEATPLPWPQWSRPITTQIWRRTRRRRALPLCQHRGSNQRDVVQRPQPPAAGRRLRPQPKARPAPRRRGAPRRVITTSVAAGRLPLRHELPTKRQRVRVRQQEDAHEYKGLRAGASRRCILQR